MTSAWREFPVFIPDGEDHVAAVITVPEGDARALVLLMTGGGGSPRSHRSSMFARAARRLAVLGFASVRVDPKGVGDSTGEPGFDLERPPIEPTLAAARFAMRATGIDTLGIAGNCGGARATMDLLPQLPELRSAVLMFVKPLATARSSHPVVLRTKAAVQRIPVLGSAAYRTYWWARSGRAQPLVQKLRSMVGTIDVLMLEADTPKAGRLLSDGYGLRGANGRRFEIRQLPGGATRAFRSPDRQRFAMDALVEWFDQTLPRAAVPERS